jgi:uncharacterized membrane protein YecN with MAPEG domain
MNSGLMRIQGMGLFLLLMLMVQGDAWACAVCGTALESSRKAFIYSTALLSIVPLAAIGGVVFYLYWANHRKQ